MLGLQHFWVVFFRAAKTVILSIDKVDMGIVWDLQGLYATTFHSEAEQIYETLENVRTPIPIMYSSRRCSPKAAG